MRTLLCLTLTSTGLAAADDTCFLFSSFRGNGEDGLHLAWSADGLRWTALGGDKSYLKPTVGKGKLMRDPCLLYGPDGVFRLVWTTGWYDRTIGYASSPDLLTWSPQQALGVMEHEPTARNAWAPEMYYDAGTRQYLVFWATTIPGRFPQTDQTGDGGLNHRMYAITTKDFATFTPTKLFYDGGFNVIDATLAKVGERYALVVKDETKTPVRKHLRVCWGDQAAGPFGPAGPAFTPDWVEGPSVVRVGDAWIVYYDCYTKHRYGAHKTKDFVSFEDISAQLSFPRDTRHGTVLQVPRAIVDRLRQ